MRIKKKVNNKKLVPSENKSDIIMSKKKKWASIPITPLMPRKYSASDRKKLREYEQYLLSAHGDEHSTERESMVGREFFHEQDIDDSFR